MSGRPFTRTNCLVEPKRVDAPAASTTTWTWLGSADGDSVITLTSGEEPDRDDGHGANTRDDSGLGGDLADRRARDHVEHHEDGDQREHDDCQAHEQASRAAQGADFGAG